MKTCIKCGDPKDESEFYGKHTACKTCHNLYMKDRYNSNVEESRKYVRDYMREWRIKNRAKVLEYNKKRKSLAQKERVCPDCGATGTMEKRRRRCRECQTKHRDEMHIEKLRYAREYGRIKRESWAPEDLAQEAERKHKWYMSKRDKILEKHKLYRKKNRKILNAKGRERYHAIR